MNGIKIGKVGKSENSQTDEEREDQEEDKFCKSIIRGIARRNREKNARYWQRLEEKKNNTSCDDVSGKELPWHEVRKARERELKYSRDLGVYEKSR